MSKENEKIEFETIGSLENSKSNDQPHIIKLNNIFIIKTLLIYFSTKNIEYIIFYQIYTILKVFFTVHDPTTLNRQGADEGTQYRSVIFYRNGEQKKIAEDIKSGLDKSGAFDAPIVTEITAFDVFYKAEDYHQNYYNLNKNKNPYCTYVIVPKVEKFEKYFADKLKK